MDVTAHIRPAQVVAHPPLTVVVDEARAAELGMTATEARHVQQLAAGWEQQEMARYAFLSGNGLNMRIYRIRERYGVRTTPQLIAWAYQHGVLVVSPRA
jgi:DNA-binding CsgD family transcriptional regulator